MKRSLSSLFYIYSELYVSVFFGFAALIELICGLFLNHWGIDSIAYLAFGGAVFFALVALSFVYSVYKSEKKG
jgi:ABC-type amino acid transport system permease subunit